MLIKLVCGFDAININRLSIRTMSMVPSEFVLTGFDHIFFSVERGGASEPSHAHSRQHVG